MHCLNLLQMVSKELDLFESGKGLSDSPCECCIEPLGSISRGVSYYTKLKTQFGSKSVIYR